MCNTQAGAGGVKGWMVYVKRGEGGEPYLHGTWYVFRFHKGVAVPLTGQISRKHPKRTSPARTMGKRRV